MPLHSPFYTGTGELKSSCLPSKYLSKPSPYAFAFPSLGALPHELHLLNFPDAFWEQMRCMDLEEGLRRWTQVWNQVSSGLE